MDPHKLYMVGKRRFSALKCILVCQNLLIIEATGAIWKFSNSQWSNLWFIGPFFQNAPVEYIGVYSDTNELISPLRNILIWILIENWTEVRPLIPLLFIFYTIQVHVVTYCFWSWIRISIDKTMGASKNHLGGPWIQKIGRSYCLTLKLNTLLFHSRWKPNVDYPTN